MAIRILEIEFNDELVDMQKLAAKVSVSLREHGFDTKFAGQNRIRLIERNPNAVRQTRECSVYRIPTLRMLADGSKVGKASQQLSGIAHPHIDGPGNGGDAA